MTRQISPEIQTSGRLNPSTTTVPSLDEEVWQTWIKKNERLDKIKFARRVKVIAILVLILSVAALVRFL